LVFDVWHSSCASCIKKFPAFQKLHDQFSHDKNVYLISLNIPLRKDRGLKPVQFTEKYSFDNLYFQNEIDAEKLSIDAVPLILVFDKNLTCQYAGDLNFGWNILFGNVEDIIKKLSKQ
jgi:hypothetical protein